MQLQTKLKIKKYLPPFFIHLGMMFLTLKNIFLYPDFFKQYLKFKNLSSLTKQRFKIGFWDILPRLNDATISTDFDHHYIYHPAWAARIVKKINPVFHIDISSTLHFCSQLSAFIPVKFYDYRPVVLELDNLESGHADLTRLPFEDNTVDSLSCMHTIEHIGLGRYGDPIDPEGDLKAISELKRVLSPGGSLLFVVPIGQPKIMFNAHRIYSYNQVTEYFKDLSLQEFALITDTGFGKDFIVPATKQLSDQQIYGCGCFWFKKL